MDNSFVKAKKPVSGNSKLKFIICTGYGNSGSSAGTDFFKEFSSVQVPFDNFECTFLHETDGIADLAYALEHEGHRLKADLAVKRFLNLVRNLNKNYGYAHYFKNNFLPCMTDYIEELVTCKWKGGWHRGAEVKKETLKDKARKDLSFIYFDEKYRRAHYALYESDLWHPQYIPYENQYYTNAKERFLPITKKYIQKLFSFLESSECEYSVIDQLLPANSNDLYARFFDWIKTIIIDRDPRDLYFANKVFWGARYIPTHNIDIFIQWFKETRREQIKQQSSDVLHIKLENLIYDYKKTTQELMRFTGISPHAHTQKFKFFNPEKSKVNTRLWLKYKHNFSNDIKKIEQELAPFCFDYSKYNLKETDTRTTIDFMFYKLQHEVDTLRIHTHISLKLRFLYLKRKLIRSALDAPVVKTMQWFLNEKKTPTLCLRFFIKFGVYTTLFPFYYLYEIIKAIINFIIM